MHNKARTESALEIAGAQHEECDTTAVNNEKESKTQKVKRALKKEAIKINNINKEQIPVCRCGKISKIFTCMGDSTLSSISVFAELRRSKPIFCVKLSSRDCVKVLTFSFNTASTTFNFSGFSCTVSVAESLLDLP